MADLAKISSHLLTDWRARKTRIRKTRIRHEAFAKEAYRRYNQMESRTRYREGDQ